ncbi:hypothetical protein VN0498_11540 [Helicobacter pylori]
MLDQDVLQNSHEAGVGGLESEMLNGFVSFIKSIYECQKKGKDPKEALKCTAIATLKCGAYGYGVAFSSSLLGSVMQNSANQFIQSLGNGSIPTMVVGVGVGSCEVLIKYFHGKININSVECLEKLGEKTPNF